MEGKQGPIADGSMTEVSLRELFEAVVDLPPAERHAWLDARGIGPTQRARLERMLAADTGAAGVLVAASAAELAEAVGDVDPPARCARFAHVGSFTLGERLGEGGHATVFRAFRESAGVRQEVALKLLHRDLNSPDAQRRFRRERLALAQLDHPNIARLIEGGVSDSGQPYIVLELVEGQPITAHARDHRLGLHQRLALFVQVCGAVAAAHRSLIVHRDLKPSNVLVTAAGQVKLLDFGIAKLLEEDSDATRTQLPAFTPAYAAPEQIRNGPITTATDVYALGVLLGELLTGRRLDLGGGRTPSAMVPDSDAVVPLSLQPRTLRRALRGDLDRVLAKALAADPDLRYASAAALADDIERHLGGQPVAAHPPSGWYRARKFVRRHRGGVVTTLAFLLAVLASLGMALWQAQQAQRQARRAGEIQAFVEDLFHPLERGRAVGQAPSVQELVQRGLQRVDQRYPEDAQVRAELLAMFARINEGMGEVQGNHALSEAAWRANAAAFGEQDPRTLETRSLHARVLRRLGRYDAALAEYAAVRAAMRTQGTRGNAYARVLDAISMVRMEQGMDGAEAIALKREALDERLADPQATPDDLATGYNNLGAAYQYAGDYDQALAWYRNAYELSRQTEGDSVGVATDLANIGQAHSRLGRWREALADTEEARAIYARIPLEQHPNLVSVLIRQCALEAALERFEAAAASCDAAVAMARDVFGETHVQHALALIRRAEAASATGRFDAAGADIDSASGIFGRSEATSASAQRVLKGARLQLLRLRDQWPELRDALLLLAGDAAVARQPLAMPVFAWTALACRRAPAAGCDDDWTVRADRVLAQSRFARDPNRLLAQIALAEIELENSRPAHAIERLASAMSISEKELGAQHSWFAEAHLLLARAQEQAGDRAAATGHRARAERIIGALPASHPLHRHLR